MSLRLWQLDCIKEIEMSERKKEDADINLSASTETKLRSPQRVPPRHRYEAPGGV
jgi:hypothetical protein